MKNIQESAEFFKEIGPGIASQLSETLTRLTSEEIRVEFSSVRTFEQSRVFVGVDERCFGTYMDFKKTGNNLEGIVAVIFSVSSSKIMIELLLKRYLGGLDMEKVDNEMRLSIFKEAANIIASTYIAGVANALRIKIKTEVPKFACFDSVDMIRPTLLRSYSELDSLVSIGEFKIYRESKDLPSLKGALLLFFSR
ncbi:MAG: hypothetical protein AAB110_07115 [Candidatus Desantisbacteria bacterium]